ncbi:MAG: hypothetical protein Q9166_006932 [cf. Caloplaca sp. 2 TL-2023]
MIGSRSYDELYVGPSARRTSKYERALSGFGPTIYTFSTISHELHRPRRGAVVTFFSKALVQQFEPSVQAMIEELAARLDKLKGTGTIINMIDMPHVRHYLSMVREKVDQVEVELRENKRLDGQRTIFHDLFTSNQLIPEEKTAERLAAEGVGIVSAGLVPIIVVAYLGSKST